MTRSVPSRIDPGHAPNILLIRLRRIGDVVMTTPAVAVLRNRFPQARIAYLIEEPYRELIEGHPGVDEPLVVPRRMPRRDFLKLIREIRRRRFDIAVDFHGGPKAFLIALLSGAGHRIGYRIPYKHIFYHRALPRRPEHGIFHSVENHLNLVSLLGVETDPPPGMSLPPATASETDRVKRWLDETEGQGGRRIVLHIGAGNRFRDWGEDHLRDLSTLLLRIPGTEVVLAGAESDMPRAGRMLRDGPGRLRSATGIFNLRELRELIARSALFVGADSGPMHIAATTATPIVALFGPTLPAHFAPWQADAVLIQKDIACRPCRQRECRHDDFRCLQTITPEEVLEACRRVLTTTD